MQTQKSEFRLTPQVREEIIRIIDQRIGEVHVRREDFTELKGIVKELAEAQKRSEERLTRVEHAVEELAEAQKRSEERLTRVEHAVEELAEAQKRTEKRVEELAEAQKRTEDELRTLVEEHKKTRQMVGNLSDVVGYGLEDRIMPYMYDFAKKVYGVSVDIVDRRNVIYPDGRYDEINIYVEGRKNGKKVYIIGECKAQPGKKDADGFTRLLRRLKGHLGGEVKGFLVGYTFSPDVEEYVREKYPEIKLIKSYEFGVRYRSRP